jgi:quercetin dioxygenase-like cupin family protein
VTDRFTVLRLDDVEPITVAGGLQWRPLRRSLGVEAFGINAYVADAAGDDVVEAHDESSLGHEEVYVVVEGRATFTLDGDEIDAPAGSVVFVRDPTVRRFARAEEPGTTVLVVGGKRGEAYTPSQWESSFHAERHRATGDWEAMAAELTEGLAAHPDGAGLLYSLACAESLAGRHDDALDHLRRALEIDPGLGKYLATDTDLDPIRGHAGFPA